MEKKHLLASSDSEEDLRFYPQIIPPTKQKKNYVIDFKKLHRIVMSGNLDKIRDILKEQNLQLSGANGLTVLHTVAASNNKEVLSLLLEDKRFLALLNRQDKDGVTPLITAMMSGSYDALELLCTQGADPTKTLSKNGDNVLHLAARGNDSKAAEIVLKYFSSPELINAVNYNGNTPLIEAVHDQSWVLHFLLTAGADITIQNLENGRTLLHVVVAYNRLGLLKTILQHPQATVHFAEIKDMKDDTALLIAVKLDRLKMVNLLLNTFDNLTGINPSSQETVFHIAIRHDRVDILELLLNSGCKSCIDYMDHNNRTPLLYAAELDNASCLKELIENGADYNLRNPDTGETFVHVIARHFSNSTLPYIMDIADVSWFFIQTDFQGNTPYMTAISNGNPLFLHEALKIKPVDLCDENSEGEPPVYYTAKHGHLKTMMTLLMSPRYYYFLKNNKKCNELSDPKEIVKLEMKGDLCATDVYLILGKVIKHPLVPWFPPGLLRKTRDNRNVFHACAVGGNSQGLKFLFDFFSLFGSKYLKEMFDTVDLMGNTPLLFAAQCGVVSISCVYFFVTHGADLTSINNAGLNVFDAILTYCPEVAQSLIIRLLNSCVMVTREHYYEDKININVNFSILCPKENSQVRVVYTLFNEMTKHNNIKAKRIVLQHPVIEMFLKSKYQRIKFITVLRFLSLVFATLGVAYVMPFLYIGDDPKNKYSFLTPFILNTLQGVLLFLSVFFLCFKTPMLIRRSVWPTDVVAFFPFITTVLVMYFGRNFILAPELTAALILAYSMLAMVSIITMYYTCSFQIAVFFEIFYAIYKHLLVLSITVFAFALSFFCLYPNHKDFSSFPMSLIYTFIVLLPGYFSDLPTIKKDYFTSTPITFHFLLECLILGAFTVMVVVGFINMLIGLAVRSANVAEIDGKVYQQHLLAHFLYMIEFWFDNRLYLWFLKKGILTAKLKKLRDCTNLKLNVELHDEATKDRIFNSLIIRFKSIIFQEQQLATSSTAVRKTQESLGIVIQDRI